MAQSKSHSFIKVYFLFTWVIGVDEYLCSRHSFMEKAVTADS